MTALRKFLPCDHEAQFHVERFDAFSTFIDALNAPVPLKIANCLPKPDGYFEWGNLRFCSQASNQDGPLTVSPRTGGAA